MINSMEKYFIVAFGEFSEWYFEGFNTLSINKIPDGYITKDISNAFRFTDRNYARKVARYYGGIVIERGKR